MLPSGGDSLELMTAAEVIGLVRRLLGEMERMRAEREKVDGAFARLQVENQTLKDEFARLKGLPPRPPHKPSGMEKATDRPERGAKSDEEEATKRRRGPGVSKLSIDRTETLSVGPPAGSRHKGYEDIIVQDLAVKAEATRYRRERWEAADGERLIAPLPVGIVGGCGPHLHHLVLTLHFQGQMTCERIVAFLAGLGLAISKRQVVRLVHAKLEGFRAEDDAVLRAGLAGSPFVTVDDTGTRHAGRPASPPTSAPTGSPRSAPGRANRAWLSWVVCSAARPATSSTARRSPTCAAPICRRTSSTNSPAMRRSSSARARTG